MNKIKLTEEQVREAFKNAKSDEVKNMLTGLFPDIAKKLAKNKPTLNDYTSITSYDDACEALGERPWLNGFDGDVYDKDNDYIGGIPPHIIALMKLEAISRALWGKNWKPIPDAEGSNIFYYPWFFLYTNNENDHMAVQQTVALLPFISSNGETAGFGRTSTDNRSSCSLADDGFRLCQETEDKAIYFGGQNFVKLWGDYLRFDFGVGNFIQD